MTHHPSLPFALDLAHRRSLRSAMAHAAASRLADPIGARRRVIRLWAYVEAHLYGECPEPMNPGLSTELAKASRLHDLERQALEAITGPADHDVARLRWLAAARAFDLHLYTVLEWFEVQSTVPHGTVYDASPATDVAADLLDVDIAGHGLTDAVEIVPGPGGSGTVGLLVVSWEAVTAPTRSRGAVTLARMAWSLLEGAPVDVSGLAEIDGRYVAVAASAFARLAKRS